MMPVIIERDESAGITQDDYEYTRVVETARPRPPQLLAGAELRRR